MAEQSKIQWTDHTFNPWRGCAKVAAGCTNCYAETNVGVKMHGIKWGTEKQGGTRVVAADSMWQQPLKWNQNGERERVFCASLADVFEDWPGTMRNHKGEPLFLGADGDCPVTMADCRERLFETIDLTPNLDWLLLTKRPENIKRMWVSRNMGLGPLNPGLAERTQETLHEHNKPLHDEVFRRDNVWLGTSASTQDEAYENWYTLQGAGVLCEVLFLSLEPLVGPINLAKVWRNGPLPDWVIVGGESGTNARPCDILWIHEIVEQCNEMGVSCFVKQLGADPTAGDLRMKPTRDRKGGDPAEWPESLRVREFPMAHQRM